MQVRTHILMLVVLKHGLVPTPLYDQTPVDGCFLEIGIDLSPMG